MSRRHRAEKRPVVPDNRFNTELITRFVNILMERGKKCTAEKIVYGAVEQIGELAQVEDPMQYFSQAIENVKPRLEVKSRRVGGATYQVPVEVSSDRQVALALRWIIDYAAGRKGIGMGKALAMEVMDAYKNQGNAIKKRDDVHKMAQANKAFAHYRW
jgi:small subunit ribosomal protein S7